MKRAVARTLIAAGALTLLAPGARGGGAPDPTAARPPAPQLGSVKTAVKDVVAGAMPAGKPGETAKPGDAAKPAPVDAAAERVATLRKKVLRDDDFVENDDANRDPFRSYLRAFQDKATHRTQQIPALFEKFALEELQLIAVVSGDANPRAMFRDPNGLGQTIKRGDYVSKAGARITKILSDRVVLELNETTPSGETRALEKAVLVNPEGAQK